jgi:hypothetical protein
VSKRASITIANRESAAKRPLFPFLDLPAQYAGIRDQVLAAVARVLERQSFILGPEVESMTTSSPLFDPTLEAIWQGGINYASVIATALRDL